MTKKIGILTFHKAINYGAFLQCFALQQWLSNNLKDVSVEIIDHVPPMERRKVYLNVLREVKKNGFHCALKEIKKIKAFRKSYSRLVLSSPFKTKKIEALYKKLNSQYDMIIVGSDAVLNWTQNGYPSVYYMDFDFSIPIVSYAASVHGLQYYNITPDQKTYCTRCFERFKFLAVRDQCTYQFVKYFCPEKEVIHTCDPTFIIDRAMIKSIAGDVYSECKRSYGFDMHKPYIVLMTLNETVSKYISDKYLNEYTIVTLFKPNKYADFYLFDLDPFSWTQVLAHAKLVITQYFHGTLLSLRHETPVIAIDASHYDGEYESKMYDLMITRLRLPYLYVSEKELDKERIDKLKVVIDNAIAGGYKNEINTAINREASSALQFIEKVSSLLDE